MQVLLDGKVVAAVERSCPRKVQLPEVLVFLSNVTVLDIVVHAMGRNSGGCAWDSKGLVNLNVQLNGGGLPRQDASSQGFTAAAARRSLVEVKWLSLSGSGNS